MLSYTTQNHLTRVGIDHSELYPPKAVIKQENIPTDLTTDQSDASDSLTKILLSQI